MTIVIMENIGNEDFQMHESLKRRRPLFDIPSQSTEDVVVKMSYVIDALTQNVIELKRRVERLEVRQKEESKE